MHAYGFGDARFSCCDLRNGCYKRQKPESETGKRISRQMKRVARQKGKTEIRNAQSEE